MGGWKKTPSGYAGPEHSNIKQACLNLGDVILITKETFWCKTMAGSPISPAAVWLSHIFCALPWRNRKEWYVEKSHGLCFSRTGACSPSKTLAGGYANGRWDTNKEHTPEGLGHPKRDHCSGSATWNQEHITERKCVHHILLSPVVKGNHSRDQKKETQGCHFLAN